MTETFRVSITRDFLAANDCVTIGDIGLGLLDEAASVEWEFLVETTR
ncbi:MAG: hypothetical protein H0T72_02715 [Chloroflexia bacterium]|jgi:hypothetical protein|nr:hypothetical protein [Chloroflexia bacterium]